MGKVAELGGVAVLPSALATSVGPVPFDDPRVAVDFAFEASPDFPTVPVLESLDASLLAQAVHDVHGVRVVAPGRVEVERPECLDAFAVDAVGAARWERPHGPPFAALDSFVARLDPAADVPVRIGVAGPVTLAIALAAAGVTKDRALAAATALSTRRALTSLDVLTEARQGPTAVVLVEPGLIGAMHPTFPLTPYQVRSLLDPVVGALDEAAAPGQLLVGVHVPGRTDWATIIGSGISLLSAPADAGLVGWAEPLLALMEAGGRIAWGAVPVDRPLGTGELRLWRGLAEVWGQLAAAGVDPVLVRDRSLLSPADGLAHFLPGQAELVASLTRSLAARVHRQLHAARLPLGA